MEEDSAGKNNTKTKRPNEKMLRKIYWGKGKFRDLKQPTEPPKISEIKSANQGVFRCTL